MSYDGWSVVGESFNNPDGSSRQDEIRRCGVGESVRLQPEPDNPHDPNAVAVYSLRSVKIGYLCRADASYFMDATYEDGVCFEASIGCIGGGTPDRPHLGVWLDVFER